MSLPGNYTTGQAFTAANENAVEAAVNADTNAIAALTREITVSGAAGDTAAITAAITAMTTAGKVTGTAETVRSSYARINAATTINLGYTDTGASWSTVSHEKVRLRLDILPDANLGAALTIKGGYNCELDINVLGGGNRATVTDAATTNGSTTVTSVAAVTGGLKAGAIVEISGAGYTPEGTTESLQVSVRSVNTGANTFVVSEAAFATLTGATMIWMDVAVRLEDHLGLTWRIQGKAYDGCVLAGDATDDSTKRIRGLCGPNQLNGEGVGKTIFWKSMEAHGSMGTIWGSSATPDYFGSCADIHVDHFEGGVYDQTITPQCYLILDRCNELNDWSLSFGDRATEALIKIIGGDVGRFSQIRCTTYQCQATATTTNGSATLTAVVATVLTPRVGSLITGPGIPANTYIGTATGPFTGGGGTVTLVNAPTGGSAVNATATASGVAILGYAAPAGLKLVGVKSIKGKLETSTAQKGLYIIGGGVNGINLEHKSLTYEFNPLYITPGTVGTAPRIRVEADYHFCRESAVRVTSGMTGGILQIPGYIDTPNLDDLSVYGINVASALFNLDVAELTMPNRTSNFQGSILHSDPALIHNVGRARLGNTVVHGIASGATSFALTSGGATQNASDKPIQVFYTVRHQPTSGTTTTAQLFVGRLNSAMTSMGSDACQATAGTGTRDEVHVRNFMVPPWWYFGVTLSANATFPANAVSHPLN